MNPNVVRRLFWALRQEARCHNCMIGLDADDLRIVYQKWHPLIIVGVSWMVRN